MNSSSNAKAGATVRGRSRRIAGVTVLMVAGAAAATLALAEDRVPAEPWGRDSAAGRCVVCHSLEENGPFRYAPNLFGIVGSEKTRDREWFGYSLALMKKGGTWTAEDLDAYLEDASAFAPGGAKKIRVADAEERRAIIDFLATLTP